LLQLSAVAAAAVAAVVADATAAATMTAVKCLPSFSKGNEICMYVHLYVYIQSEKEVKADNRRQKPHCSMQQQPHCSGNLNFAAAADMIYIHGCCRSNRLPIASGRSGKMVLAIIIPI